MRVFDQQKQNVEQQYNAGRDIYVGNPVSRKARIIELSQEITNFEARIKKLEREIIDHNKNFIDSLPKELRDKKRLVGLEIETDSLTSWHLVGVIYVLTNYRKLKRLENVFERYEEQHKGYMSELESLKRHLNILQGELNTLHKGSDQAQAE
jgi:cell division protein FtsB